MHVLDGLSLEPVDIGEPADDCFDVSLRLRAPLTWWWLRRMGFRLTSSHGDAVPHMVAMVHASYDLALEVAPASPGAPTWHVWIRSDLSLSTRRFCFVRFVTSVGELAALMLAISDGPIASVNFDATTFRAELALESRDARRRFAEYVRDARWVHIPG